MWLRLVSVLASRNCLTRCWKNCFYIMSASIPARGFKTFWHTIIIIRVLWIPLSLERSKQHANLSLRHVYEEYIKCYYHSILIWMEKLRLTESKWFQVIQPREEASMQTSISSLKKIWWMTFVPPATPFYNSIKW